MYSHPAQNVADVNMNSCAGEWGNIVGRVAEFMCGRVGKHIGAGGCPKIIVVVARTTVMGSILPFTDFRSADIALRFCFGLFFHVPFSCSPFTFLPTCHLPSVHPLSMKSTKKKNRRLFNDISSVGPPGERGPVNNSDRTADCDVPLPIFSCVHVLRDRSQ
jgi:hypothetical protein